MEITQLAGERRVRHEFVGKCEKKEGKRRTTYLDRLKRCGTPASVLEKEERPAKDGESRRRREGERERREVWYWWRQL